MKPGTTTTLRAIIDTALGGQLDEALARKLHKLGPEAVALAMLSTCRRKEPVLHSFLCASVLLW